MTVYYLFMRLCILFIFFFFFSSRRRHTRWNCDWSSDVCSSDLGLAGGRTGCRTRDQAIEVARAAAGSRRLSLTGVEGFEGIIGGDDQAAVLGKVDTFMSEMRALVVDLDAARLFDESAEVLITAGGSAFLDRVIAGFGKPLQRSEEHTSELQSQF